MNATPTADQALVQMFAVLMADESTAQIAEDLRELCDEFIDSGDQCTSGQMMVIVQRLREAHPDHAARILNLAIETGV